LRSHDERRFYTEWNGATKEFVKKQRTGTRPVRVEIENCQEAVLIGLGGGSGNVGVFLLETFYAASGVDQFLFAGEEWVAVRANFDAQHITLDGGASLERVSASAVDGYGVIIGVDTGLHNSPFVVSGLRGKEEMDENRRVARSRDNR